MIHHARRTQKAILKLAGLCACLTLLFSLLAWLPIRSSQAQQSTPYTKPRWMAKMLALQAGTSGRPSSGITVGDNIDVSNEPGPQSETFIAVDTVSPQILAGASNEIFRNPQRTYFSLNGGASWFAADQPLVDEQGTTWTFASDPGVCIDTRGTIFFSQLLIASVDNNFKGDAMIVNRTTDFGASFSPGVILKKDLNAGALGRFEDKPLTTCDTSPTSPFRDNVYVAWDTTQGAATSIVNFARSTDGGITFTTQRIDDPNAGAGAAEIGAIPAVGPNGEVYVAWLDVTNSRLRVDRSFDGGLNFGRDTTISPLIISFDTGIPSIKVRRALVYPALDVDRSDGPHRGRLFVAWMDQADQTKPFIDGAGTDLFFAFSDDQGFHWSAPVRIADDGVGADQFYPWLSVDRTNGSVNISWYDTRNDPARRKTDIFYARSTDGGLTFSPNVRVTTASTDESCPVCEDLVAQTGLTPSTARFCSRSCAAEVLNQYGDYTGNASFGGISHPIWTDRRTGEPKNEEIFTAAISAKKK